MLDPMLRYFQNTTLGWSIWIGGQRWADALSCAAETAAGWRARTMGMGMDDGGRILESGGAAATEFWWYFALNCRLQARVRQVGSAVVLISRSNLQLRWPVWRALRPAVVHSAALHRS